MSKVSYKDNKMSIVYLLANIKLNLKSKQILTSMDLLSSS